MKTLHKFILIAGLEAILATGCTTSFLPNIIIQPSSSVSVAPSTTPSGTSASIIISQVNVNLSSTGNTTTPQPSSSPSASPSPGSGPSYVTTIFFDTAKSKDSISNHCSTSTSSTNQKSCSCQFSWGDLTSTNSTTTSISRKVQTPITSIQSNLVSCKAPSVWGSEIIDGTKISITVIPAPTNVDAGTFSVSVYSYTKNSKSTSGSFQDLAGNIYDNIHRYSCYQKFKRGMQIVPKRVNITNPKDSASYQALYATRFCVALSNSSASSQSDCSSPTAPDYSSQSYYFNLYIRNSERGDINLFNSSYVCPRVKENLDPDPISGRTGQVWPLDATFALSVGPTDTFVIGVEANTKLGSAQDPVVGSNSCYTSSSGSSSSTGSQDNSSSIVRSCLGFAAKPNSDGTCPSIQDANQQVMPTFRLRRYYAIYPRSFDTDGKPIQGQNQSIDTIYVLDRPVNTPSNSNHLKPYTMLGPKPCPFAFFDRKGVTLTPVVSPIPSPISSPYPNPPSSPFPIHPAGYVSSSDSVWNGTNIDGIEFPNLDGLDEDGIRQCSAFLPFLTQNASGIRQYVFRTINRYNMRPETRHAYIRPIQAFTPHYEEDQNFQACAPQARPLQDAPLHFVRDPVYGNVAWCAESYPTQNPNVREFDPTAYGVIPFTSHVVKNSSSNSCSPTILALPSAYNVVTIDPATNNRLSTAKHSSNSAWEGSFANRTCDRTVLQNTLPSTNGGSVSGSSEWPRFPLLAHAKNIESSIYKDKSYFCSITYDDNGEKTGNQTPSSGCCSLTSVQVPSFSLSSGSSNAAGASSSTPLSGHLEPDIGCNNPTY